MKVLALNPGSNSIKFQVIDVQSERVWGRKLVTGVIEPVNRDASVTATDRTGATRLRENVPLESHGAAAELILAKIEAGTFEGSGIRNLQDLEIIACRVVHGANRFRHPIEVDTAAIGEIEALDDFAPLHNHNSVSILKACMPLNRQPGSLIAIFDSAFHSTLPEVAYRYALPFELAEKHGIRRYGFHGISHKYLLLRYAELHHISPQRTNIVTLHLEGGSSAAAIRNGQSIDTSMGLTPLEGLVMATRSGDVDPAIVGLLARKENVPVDVVEKWLNEESGLLGVSGVSPDTRVLVGCADRRSRLALDLFSYRARKYVGAYLAALGGADAIVFGGGIGENTPEVRRRICEGLEWAGLLFDQRINVRVVDREGRLTREGSRLHAYVIPTEEGLMMAREAVEWTRQSA